MKTNLPIETNHFKLLALKDYCFTQFRDINLILRESISTKADFDRIYALTYGTGITTEAMFNDFICNINLLDEMFQDRKCKQPIITYRKFDSKKLLNLVIGGTFIDKGFVSTSIDKDSLKNVLHSDVLKYDAIAKIMVPIDTSCVFIGDIFNRKETELLLNRGLEYKLISMEDNLFTFEIV
ncbi:ADP-ribosyltransferase [Enterococcus sp. AZ192]|uniref:ADP-ribosyltransferase n=1 Tax=unclassified Enterococcus TaxID=2608891 RepID=UPI003D2D7B45